MLSMQEARVGVPVTQYAPGTTRSDPEHRRLCSLPKKDEALSITSTPQGGFCGPQTYISVLALCQAMHPEDQREASTGLTAKAYSLFISDTPKIGLIL